MIKGYRELTDDEIKSINDVKVMADVIGRIINKLENVDEVDKRWLSIAKTDLQKGFMFLVRSIAKPSSF